MRINYRHSEETKRKIALGKKGKKFSLEHRKNLSVAHKGQAGYWTGKKRGSMSQEIKDKIRVSNIGAHIDFTNFRRGVNNNKWKGGITPINDRIRKSPEYKKWRNEVFARDNYTCVICGSSKVYLHADHIKPFAYYAELRFELSNGRTLCVPCHLKTDTYAGKGFKRK